MSPAHSSALRSGLAETRRAMQSLRASPLDDLGLKLALQSLAEITAQQSGMQLDLDLAAIPELPPAVEQHFYRVAQEALTNVLRHASASRLLVSLQRVEGKHVSGASNFPRSKFWC